MVATISKAVLVEGIQDTMEMHKMAEASALDEEVGSDSDDWATIILIHY